MFKHKSRNVMTSTGVWAYVILITLLAFIYSYQEDGTQRFIKEYSGVITFCIIIGLLLCLLQSQFVYINTRFKEEDYNKLYSYKDLAHFKGVIPIVAVLGISRTGKTTLIDSIFYNKPSNKRTQSINGRLKNIGNDKDFLIFDMSGENNIQINDVMHFSDCIIFLLDHTESSSDSNIDEQRINANIRLINDLCSSYNEKEHHKKIPTLFLINKSDLLHDCDLYEQFYKKEINNWKHVFGRKTNYMEYSNKYITEAIDNTASIAYELNDVIGFIKENVYEK